MPLQAVNAAGRGKRGPYEHILVSILPGGDRERIGKSMKRENFIPFSKKDLIEHLARRIQDAGTRGQFAAFCRTVEGIYHYQFDRDLEELKSSYAALDPDRITGLIPGISPAGDLSSGRELLDKVKRVLIAANYREITKERLQEALGNVSPWGLELKVDPDEYSLLTLHYREEYPESVVKRTFLLKRKFDYSVFRHVVLVFQLKSENRMPNGPGREGKGKYRSDKVYLKLFKNVPTVDLEMLFPDTEIQIKMSDKLKVIFPLAIGAVSSLYKIFSYILGHENLQQLWSQIGFWALVGGLFGVGLKGFSNYRNTIERYLKSLTESLYFQNLDNNSGVFKYLLDDAEEEECKELILGYYFLHFEADRNYGELELDERIELYFRDELKAEIDFEVDDSIRKLAELELLSSRDGVLKVVPLPTALEILRTRLISQIGAIRPTGSDA
jgi:hypothetical protein